MRGLQRDRGLATLLTVASPFLLGTYLLVLVAPGLEATATRSVGTLLPTRTALDVPAGLALLAVGAFAMAAGRWSVAVLGTAAAFAWLAAKMAFPAPDGAPWLRLAAEPLVLPIVALLLVHAPSDAADRRVRRLVDLLVVVGAAIVIARIVTFDPFYEPTCATTCTHVAPMFDVGAAGATALRRGVEAWNLVVGGTLLVIAVSALTSSRTGRHSTVLGLAGAVVAGGAAAGISIAQLNRAGLGTQARDLGAVVPPAQTVLAVGAGMIALAVFWSLVDTVRARARVRAIVDAMEESARSGSIEDQLRQALADPRLQVGYPILPDGGVVTADGSAFAAAAASGLTATIVERGRQQIAIVAHRSDVEGSTLLRELSPSILVALDNERLAAANRALAKELHASAAALLSAADGHRRRIERDLHDGAQQRILALAFELRLAAAEARRTEDHARWAALTEAETLASEALDSLRLVAHGMHPAVLTEAGLLPALQSMGDTAPIAVEVESGLRQRLAATDEAVVYRIAAEALGDAVRRGATVLQLRIDREGETLRLIVEDDGSPPDGPVQRILDCVAASGGSVSGTLQGPNRAARLLVAVPCA